MSTVMPDPILPTAGASTPIADYGLLADCNGSALVDRAGAFEAERRYIPGSLAIETTFRTDKGMVRLTDVMAAAEGQRGHDLGFDAPHELLRAVVGGRARRLRRPAPGAGPPQRARVEGPHLPADGRHRRRSDDVAARDGRRRAQLGLPLLLDPRLQPDARGAVHRGVPGRGGGVRVVHDQRGGRPGRRGVAPDHVRHRRGARSLRALAGAPA